jgi:predicted dehydrogenase
MLPALAKLGGVRWRGLSTARGLNAVHSGQRMGFAYATTDVGELFGDPDTHAVFIATRHDLHADLVVRALRAGKHVFVEKPLCIRSEELAAIDACVSELGPRCPVLTVGFNRRFARATGRVREFFARVAPLSVGYRFAPGPIPANAWPQDEDIGGGRIVGEACHAIDLCVALTGSGPVRVFAESAAGPGLETSDDRVFITVRHANGSVSNVSYQAGGDRAAPPEHIEVFGGGRTAVVENWDAVQLWAREKVTREDAGQDRGHAAGFRAFLQACRGDGEWPIAWPELYGSTWASLMAVRSLREGRAIDLDERAADEPGAGAGTT